MNSINDFSLGNIFLQIDYFDSSRIMDKVGELFAHYKEIDNKVKMTALGNGLQISNYNQQIKEMKIDTSRIWFSIITDKIENIHNIIKPHVEYLNKDINVKISTRLGIRNTYLFSTKGKAIIEKINDRFSIIKDANLDTLSINKDYNDLSNKLFLQLLVSQEDSTDYAVSLDIDTSSHAKINTNDIENEIKRIIQAKQKFANEIIGGLK
jgi:hypothetical protein